MSKTSQKVTLNQVNTPTALKEGVIKINKDITSIYLLDLQYLRQNGYELHTKRQQDLETYKCTAKIEI
jgi:hypothetical protein